MTSRDDPACSTAEDLRRYYNESSGYAAVMQSHDPLYFASYVDLVHQYADGCSRVLDVGCGAGISTRELARVLGGVTCVGSDISASAIAFARQHQTAPNLAFEVADAAHLPYPDGHFCIAASCDCLEHVPDIEQALRELMRVVRPGGTVIVKGPNHMSPLVTVMDLLTFRHRYPFTLAWRDNPSRLAAQLRHFSAGLRGEVRFVTRTPDLSDRVQVGGDADAVTDMSTVTIRNFFQREGWQVLRTGWPRRPGMAGRVLAGLFPLWASMGIVARRPGSHAGLGKADQRRRARDSASAGSDS